MRCFEGLASADTMEVRMFRMNWNEYMGVCMVVQRSNEIVWSVFCLKCGLAKFLFVVLVLNTQKLSGNCESRRTQVGR